MLHNPATYSGQRNSRYSRASSR